MVRPLVEAPVLNSRLRKRYLEGGFKIGVVGPNNDLTYKYEHLGAGGDTLQQLADGSHAFWRSCETSDVDLGHGRPVTRDGAAVLAAARKIANDTGMVLDEWNGFNVLHTAASRVGGLMVGTCRATVATTKNLDGAKSGDISVVYLLAADEVDTDQLENAFVIYRPSR